MAGSTKTLGVKFQIAGVKEAQAGLDNLRKNLNASLRANKQAVNQSLGLNKTVRQELEQSNPDDFVDNYQRTVAAIRNQQYRQAINIYTRPRVNKVSGGFYEGIGNAAGARAFNQLDNLFRKLTGREEYRESIDLSTRTIQRIGVSVRDALTGNSRSQSQRERNLGKGSPGILQQETLVDKAINQALLPLKTVQYSFYEGIGSFFGNQFAEGMSGILNDELDFSMNRKGQVTGKAISYTATTGVDNFKRDVAATGDNLNDFRYAVEDGKVDQLSQKFDTLFKSVTRSITSIADSYLRGFRKGSVQLEGLRKVQQEIAQQNNQATDLTGKKKAFYTASGFAGEQGQRGYYMAEQLRPYVNDQTEVIGVETKFTDVLSPADKNAVMWGISALANLAKINLKGFNPDAVALAAKVINDLEANPDLESVELLGHSAGGFPVEETQELLDLLGYGDRVKSKIIGTPRMLGDLDNPNTERIMGSGDFRIKPLEEALEYVGAAKPTENVVKGVKDHFWQDYLDSDEFLTELLGDSLDQDKAKAHKKKRSPFQGKLIELESLYAKYISTIYQDLDELGDELSVAPDRLVAKSRRGKLRARGVTEVERKLRDKDFKPLKIKDGTEKAVIVIGGEGGAGGRSGGIFAKQIRDIAQEPGTQYIGARNPFTDVLTADDIRNPNGSETTRKILRVFEQVHELGYNPDAAEIATQVIDLLNKDPNIKVKIGGYSAGGFVGEDVIELLKAQGADLSRVEAIGVGTPELPGGIKNREFAKLLGEKDPIGYANELKELNNKIKSIIGVDIFPDLLKKTQNIEGIESHDLQDYLANSQEVQSFFYGNLPSKDLLIKYQQINQKTAETKELENQIQDVNQDKSIDVFEKLPKVTELRRQYLKLGTEIQQLAKEGVKAGGGKFFRQFYDEPEPVNQNTNQDPWSDTQEQEQQVVVNRSKQLAQKYREYLQQLKTKSDREVKETSNTVTGDFKSINKANQQNYLQTIRRSFNIKAKLYRNAVKAGQLEIAKEQGEQLIKLAATIKNLYRNLENDNDIDSEVKRSLGSYARYATSVQNEVVSGAGGKGRVKIGLPDKFQEQLDLSQEDGENVAQGFIDGVLETLASAKEAGEQLVDAVDEGIREEGEIQSPSKLAKRLGRWFAQGFGLGMAAENLEERGREVVESAQKGAKKQFRKGRINLLRGLFEFGKQAINSGQENAPGFNAAIKETTKNIRNKTKQEIDELSEDIQTEFEEEIGEVKQNLSNVQNKIAQELTTQNLRPQLVSGIRKLFDFGRANYQESKKQAPKFQAKTKQVKDNVSREVEALKDDVQQEFAEELTELENFIGEHQDKFLADNIEKFLDAAGAGIIKKIGTLLFNASQNENADQILDTVSKLLGKLARLLITFNLLKVGLDALGLGKFIEAFQNLPEKALDAAVAVESLDNRIVSMSGNAQKGAENLAFITEEAKRLQKNLTQAKENYSQILGATRDTSLEGVQTENIYSAFAATIKNKGLSSADEQDIFRSVRSVIGKGIVSSEEVRQEIGERLGDFQDNLAEAYGVQRPQLEQMLKNREIIATEALPKVAAIMSAKNDIYGEATTGAAAIQRLDNSVVSFQESVGKALLPIQKFGNNNLAKFFNMIAGWVDFLRGLVHGFFIALFANLLRLEIFGQTVQKMLLGLIKLLWTMKGAMGIFLAEMLLIAIAWKAWENVMNQLGDRLFPKIDQKIEQLTRGMEAYRQAIEDANDAQSDFKNNKLQLAEGFKLPDNKWGNFVRNALGSDYLNLDSLVREPINKSLGNKFVQGTIKTGLNFVPGGQLLQPFVSTARIKTAREVKAEETIIGNNKLSRKGDQLLKDSAQAFQAAQKLDGYRKQVEEIQSERLKLLPGDIEGLKASLAAEKKINVERDKQRKILSKYQQTLQTSINIYKEELEDLERSFLKGEIKQSAFNIQRNDRISLLQATQSRLKAINDEINKSSKNLNVFQRKLRDSNERVDGFLAGRDRNLLEQRAEIITTGIANGSGTQAIELELAEAQKQDLQARIQFIKGELAVLERDLQSPEIAAGVKRIKEELLQDNKEINETTLQRIIDTTSLNSDRQAAEGLLKQLREQTKLSNFTEQLANTLQQNRTALKDFNRTIDDYFFRINQQIKEAQIEVLRIIDQIIFKNISNTLQSALSPNANSFVNTLISSTQSLLDEAASYADKLLGQRSARYQLAGQERSLKYELRDFARNVKGAGDALIEFQEKLQGAAAPQPSAERTITSKAGDTSISSTTDSKSFSVLTVPFAPNDNGDTLPPPPPINNNNSDIVKAIREAIIGKESAGNFQAINPHSGALGYGQVMPANVASWTKQALGKSLSLTDFLIDAQAQIKTIDFKINEYFQREIGQGYDIDTAVRRVASTWYSGQPELYNNTRPQTYGTGKYPSIDSYTADILRRYKKLAPITVFDRAEQDTDFAIDKQKQVVDLKDEYLRNQEQEALEIKIENTIKSDRQKVDFNITDSQLNLDKLLDAGKDLVNQYNFQSATREAEKSLRAFNTAFSDRAQQISREIIKYTDEINAINDLKFKLPKDIKMLREAGKNREADILEENLANDTKLLIAYKEILKGLTAEYLNNTQAANIALDFVNAQNELKKQEERISQRSLLVNQQATLAEQRGTVEAQRKVKLHQEDLRLHLEILKLKQQYPEGELLDSLIKGTRRQSQVNTENINYDSQIKELELEKRLLDYQTQIGEKRAGLLSRFGVNFGAEKVKRDSAIAQENLRFEQDLVELRKKYVDQPEKLAEFSRAATELNRVNLGQIENQFKSLGKTVEDAFVSSTQGFFDQFTTNFFDGKSQRDQQVLQERLRYAEELVQLENQYRDEPGKLYHLKSRAKELNEQKLDQISGQFNIFKRAVDLGRQALLEFVKQLAKMAAQQAAAKFLSSIIGGAIGGIGGIGVPSVGNDFGSNAAGVSAFVADQGVTVGSKDVKQRKITDRTTNYLRRLFPGIAQAWNSEGEGAQLGVFHTGEELLSRKTGEAGRYQALKQKLGINPLAKIGVFADGGTIGFDAGSNILAGFSDHRPRIDLSGLSEGRRQRRDVRRELHLTQQIFTPNQDSFMLNADQRNQDLLESLQRGF